jgi:hypothetical protein
MHLDQSSVEVSILVDKIRSGEIDLQPDFQRGRVWPEQKKRRLIDTILRQWYVPAIHLVVNDNLDKVEVLDGQQRLRAIKEFMDGEFTVDGHIEPMDPHIENLDALHYAELPTDVRSRFRRFPITTVRLREYLPAEPGELFFRLNQLSPLTAAEQRNALVGRPRDQIRELRANLEKQLAGYRIGFTNARMNYDDTLSRLAVTLEGDRLDAKLTASQLEQRYRAGKGFSHTTISAIDRATSTLTIAVKTAHTDIRLNKASLFSWLYFLCDHSWTHRQAENAFFTDFFRSLEAARGSSIIQVDLLSNRLNQNIYVRLNEFTANRESIAIFNDRSSSRVNDTTSVLLRDLCLNVCAFSVAPKAILSHQPFRRRSRSLQRATAALADLPKDVTKRLLAEADLARQWESDRALG